MANLGKLEHHLTQWAEKGLLSEEQRQKILEFEQNESKSLGGNRVLYAFLILGVSIIGIGVVSLIAVNWEAIDPMVKLASDFVILILLAGGIYRAHILKNDVLFDVVSALFILSCLASIGLISQIYHTGGEIYQALLLWSVITFPLSFLSHRGFLPHLWVFGFLLMTFAWAVSPDSWWYRKNTFGDWDANLFPFFLCFPLFAYTFANLCYPIKGMARFSKNFLFWAVILAFIALGATNVYYEVIESPFSFHDYLPVILLVGTSAITLFLRKDIPQKIKAVILSLIATSIVFYLPALFYFTFPEPESVSYEGPWWDGEILGAICLIAGLFLFSIIFTLFNRPRLFNFVTLLIGIRFLGIYFQVIGDLAMTGLGLIISGLLIIALALLWYKTKERLALWVKGVVQ